MTAQQVRADRLRLEASIRGLIAQFIGEHPEVLVIGVAVEMVDTSTHSADRYDVGEVRVEVRV